VWRSSDPVTSAAHGLNNKKERKKKSKLSHTYKYKYLYTYMHMYKYICTYVLYTGEL